MGFGPESSPGSPIATAWPTRLEHARLPPSRPPHHSFDMTTPRLLIRPTENPGRCPLFSLDLLHASCYAQTLEGYVVARGILLDPVRCCGISHLATRCEPRDDWMHARSLTGKSQKIYCIGNWTCVLLGVGHVSEVAFTKASARRAFATVVGFGRGGPKPGSICVRQRCSNCKPQQYARIPVSVKYGYLFTTNLPGATSGGAVPVFQRLRGAGCGFDTSVGISLARRCLTPQMLFRRSVHSMQSPLSSGLRRPEIVVSSLCSCRTKHSVQRRMEHAESRSSVGSGWSVGRA